MLRTQATGIVLYLPVTDCDHGVCVRIYAEGSRGCIGNAVFFCNVLQMQVTGKVQPDSGRLQQVHDLSGILEHKHGLHIGRMRNQTVM